MITTNPNRTPARTHAADDAERSHRRETVGTLGAALALVLAMVGGSGAAEPVPPQVPIAVTAKGCEPMELKVAAGVTTFVITNRSSRALEWEILDGVMVVDERENIAPGFKQKLTTRLKPGTYEITCGLLDNPRGRLIVTGDVAAATKPSAGDLIGPVAEYRVTIAGLLGEFDTALRRLGAASTAGDHDAAKTAFREAKSLFLTTIPIHASVDPVARRVAADLDAVEPILFATAAEEAGAAMRRLETDGVAFVAAARPLVVPADRLVAAAVALTQHMVGELEASAPSSAMVLADVEAERAAIERVWGLFAPLAARADPAAARDLAAALERLRLELASSPGPYGGFADARTLPSDTHEPRAQAARDLAARVARLPELLGL